MTDKDLPKSQAEKNVEADAFDLVYRGEIVPGNSAEEVNQRVAASFNLDPAAIALIVPNSGQPETARQDPLSLAPLGSNVTDSAEKRNAQVVFTASLDHLSLEPVGTRMVKETEVPKIKTPDLDTSKFALE